MMAYMVEKHEENRFRAWREVVDADGGDDELLRSVGSELVDVTPLTTLASPILRRGSFQLRFADGRVFKACRFESEYRCRRGHGLLDRWIGKRSVPRTHLKIGAEDRCQEIGRSVPDRIDRCHVHTCTLVGLVPAVLSRISHHSPPLTKLRGGLSPPRSRLRAMDSGLTMPPTCSENTRTPSGSGWARVCVWRAAILILRGGSMSSIPPPHAGADKSTSVYVAPLRGTPPPRGTPPRGAQPGPEVLL